MRASSTAAAPVRVPDPGVALTRVVVESVTPTVDGGRFAAKAVAGDDLVVEADVFADGHDLLGCRVLLWGPGGEGPRAVPMRSVVNDRWRARLPLTQLGRHRFVVEGWVATLATWRRNTATKAAADLDVVLDLAEGVALLERLPGADARRWAATVAAIPPSDAARHLEDPALVAAMEQLEPREHAAASPEYEVVVDPPLARAGMWYELFPRSASPDPSRPGTLADVLAQLDELAAMGIDVLYLPPVHPIGRVSRKGRNGAVAANEDDVGSPWAIGAEEGGHDAVHPELGDLDDVARLAAGCRERGMELALDLAFQAAPDHPWVREHPEWFRQRPDGSIHFAENPPKQYQDIYPLDFSSQDWEGLWQELARVVRHWCDLGVRVFRVDNPHTKSFAFWEWLITSIKAEHPEVLFLSEAFTRPRVMHRLAKLGFSQSYTYFTWRTSAAELREYAEELALGPGHDYFRPNVWPNTPDILPEHLQTGGRPMFVSRLVLAAGLFATYGLYGPPFELAVGAPRHEGSEEYLDSEKYEVHHWDLHQPHSLRGLITRLNTIRRHHPALQRNDTLHFHACDHPRLLCWSKTDPGGTDRVLVVADPEPQGSAAGWVHLDLDALRLEPGPLRLRDVLSGGSYRWDGPHGFVALDPWGTPAHVFVVEPEP